MAKCIVLMLVFLAGFTPGFSQADKFTITGGPPLRIPGINAPTEVTINDDRPFMLLHNNQAEVGNPAMLTDVGSYFLKINASTNPDHPLWVQMGIFFLGGLSHSASSSSITAPAQLCLTTNASSMISSVVWKRDGVADGNSLLCRTATIPGMYTVTVTYSYGTESSTFTLPPMMVNPATNAPAISLSSNSYNPVEPPVIRIANWQSFERFRLLRNNIEILNTGTLDHFTVTSPATYNLLGLLNDRTAEVATQDIVITKGDIPRPEVFSDNGFEIKYENNAINLFVSKNYNAGYTWFRNDKPIDGATGGSIAISEPGIYAVQGCATYTDNTQQCLTSSPVEIFGESLLVNAVVTKTPLVENITSATQLDLLPSSQLNVATVYADGFARPVQEVIKEGSPLHNDQVVLHKYDYVGREAQQFLPITRGTSDGAFYYIPNSLKPIKDFYQQDNDKIANTAFPFGETLYEPSPLNRPLKQGAPGEEWRLTGGHAKTVSYTNNKASDNVWLWVISGSATSASTFYPEGTLTIIETTDENGSVSREFKNKTNQTVLTEKVIEGGVKLRTYFVFDDLGRLTFVIPPKTVAGLPSSSPTISAVVLAKECYSYGYDQRSRVVKKTIPAAGTDYIVYDQWDRMVLTQSANQRVKNKWTFNKYDGLNRTVMTGEIVLTGDNVAATTAVNNFYASVASNPSLRFEETGTIMHGYTNRSFPVLTNQFQAYTISYYDNYGFGASLGAAYQFTPEADLGLTSNYASSRSLLTGLKVAILGSPGHVYLKTVNYYDKKHRLIQVISDNHLGGIDRTSNSFDFTGKILKLRQVHNGLQSVTINQRFTYDPMGRKLKSYHSINNSPEILLCDYHYNEIGQVVEKNIHSTDETTFLQSQDFSYNIRGWLAQVNPTETESNVRYQDQYGYSLLYTTGNGVGTFQPSFNGNIAAVSDSRPGDAGVVNTTYNYRYDFRNQLTQANYSSAAQPGAFDLPVITYDQNGNILTLKRKGPSAATPVLIDDLVYSYDGNQLISVAESADKTKGFIKK